MIYILQKILIVCTAFPVGKVYTATAWRSEADTKKNTRNNFTESLWFDNLVTYEKVTKVSYYNSHTYRSNILETPAKLWSYWLLPKKQDGGLIVTTVNGSYVYI